MMGMTMFKEVFTAMIGYLVERIQTNYALQLIPNSFLSNSTTSATFASILLQFLLKVRKYTHHVCATHLYIGNLVETFSLKGVGSR